MAGCGVRAPRSHAALAAVERHQLDKAVDGDPDFPAGREWVRQHTWEHRLHSFVAAVTAVRAETGHRPPPQPA